MQTNKDDSAFPIFDSSGEYYHGGLTKREHFAALALQGILSSPFLNPDEYAYLAIEAADALIHGLNKTE